MDQNVRTRQTFLMWLDNLRAKVKTQVGNIFSAPYLPGKFVIFHLVTVITQMATVIIAQPPSYWYSDFAEKGITSTSTGWIISGPVFWLIFSLIYLIYLSIAIFCLTVFNYRWSLAGWFFAEFIYLYMIYDWLKGCGFGRWSNTLGKFCESFDGRTYWIIAGLILGLFLTSSVRIQVFSLPNKKAEKGISRTTLLMPLVWALILILGVTSTIQKPTYGWVPVEPSQRPGPLAEAKAAYDLKRNRLVMFGGKTYDRQRDQWIYQNDTWEWDGETWIKMPVDGPRPEARVLPGMAYDESRGVVVMFGGLSQNGYLSDTWEWDGRKWTKQCPCNSPSARSGQEMFYDPVRKKVVLYGGYNRKDFYNDAWELDSEHHTWNKIELEGKSPFAGYFALTYSPEENYALALLNGISPSTWAFQGSAWTKLNLKLEPSNRGGTALVYDPRRDVVVTFGGFGWDVTYNDTWLFDGQNWKQYKSSSQPSVRANMVMWYDAVRKHVMLFGGNNQETVFNDMWELVFASGK